MPNSGSKHQRPNLIRVVRQQTRAVQPVLNHPGGNSRFGVEGVQVAADLLNADVALRHEQLRNLERRAKPGAR